MMAQGTIYPDTIESGGTKNADKIKTHHNRVKEVLDLMEKGLVLEPLADLYKDEVRGHTIELSQRCHRINAEVGHIVALVFRQCRFGQTRLLCQRFQLQIPLHTQVFQAFLYG